MEYEDIRSNLVRNDENVRKFKLENETYYEKFINLEQNLET